MSEKIVLGGMSHQQVALELVKQIYPVSKRSMANKDEILDLYGECLKATYGHRKASSMEAVT